MQFRDIAGQALLFYYSINYQYRNYHIHHQIQEELFLINKFSKSSKFFHSIIVAKKLDDLQLDSWYWAMDHWQRTLRKCLKLFLLAPSGITSGQRFKISHESFSMNCRRISFVLRVTSTWNSFPDDVVALKTLGSFKRAFRSWMKNCFLSFCLFC